MYKLVVLACFITIAFAKPGHHFDHHDIRTVSVHSEIPVIKTAVVQQPATVAVQEKTLAKIGEQVESIPTAVSHQSQTVLHSEPAQITPVFAPAVETRYEPAVRTYEKQYIENVPVVESYAAPTLVKATYNSPIALNSYDSQSDAQVYAASAPVVNSYGAPALVKTYATPTAVNSYAAPSLLKSYVAPIAANSYTTSALTKSYATPAVVNTYATQNLIKSYATPSVANSYDSSTLIKSYASPIVANGYSSPAVVKSYAAPAFVNSYAAPYSSSYGLSHGAQYGTQYRSSAAYLKSYGNQPVIQSYVQPKFVKSYAVPAIKTSSAHLAHYPVYRSDVQHVQSW